MPLHIAKAISGKIFINDDLTAKRDYLLFVARQSKKRQKISDTWSINGNIRIRTLAGAIRTVNELGDIPDSAAITNMS